MKYIIELEQIEGTDLYRAEGANTLVFDKKGIEKILIPFNEEQKSLFEKDELVEVSQDGKDWSLRYFSHKGNQIYYVFAFGSKSNEGGRDIGYRYCRKYGTLGELV